MSPVPPVPFQLLTSLNLGPREWSQIARNASWQTIRMNLNTFARQGVFADPETLGVVARRLADPAEIRSAKVFPYQLYSAFRAASPTLPAQIINALQDAMEIAVSSVPVISGSVVVCPDISGSMHGAVTGHRRGATSAVRCLDVAALVTAALLRQNPQARVLPFDTEVRPIRFNARDTVMTNAAKLSETPGGGTSCSAPLEALVRSAEPVDLAVLISDNESWIDSSASAGRAEATRSLQAWEQIKRRHPQAKLVCLDLVPNTHTQVLERPDVLNIGGFSDQVFQRMADFARGHGTGRSLVDQIERVALNWVPSRA